LTDPKFQWVARKAKQPLPTVVAVWVALLEHASGVTQCNAGVARGNLQGFDASDFDVLFGVDDGVVATVVAALEEKGLIEDGAIASWDKRQPKREDPTGSERVAEHRARKKVEELQRQLDEANAALEAQGKPAKRDVTHGNAREDKKRGDKKGSNSSVNEDQPNQASASRLPNDWVLPSKFGLWAKDYDPGWTDAYIRELGEAFKDYWTALPDNRFAKKTDWFATWRNYLRQRVKPSDQATNGKGTRNRYWYSTVEGVLDKLTAEGMQTRPGETLPQTVDRILKKLEADEKAKNAPQPELVQAELSVPLEPVKRITPEEAKSAREAALALIAEQKRISRGAPAGAVREPAEVE
jgi:hypothetical protein